MNSKIKLHCMQNRTQGGYVTWGMPWKKGEVSADTGYILTTENGTAINVQSKPIAFWQDGSPKWTSHTANIKDNSCVYFSQGKADTYDGIKCSENDNEIVVENGKFTAVFPKKGDVLMSAPFAEARLVAVKENRTESADIQTKSEITYYGNIDKAFIEDLGALRAVIKVTGTHKAKDNSTFLPFIVRFIVKADSDSVDIKHTFLYDADTGTDFIKGVGIRFTRPMFGKLYNRRIKITGDFGVMHEPLVLVSSWRPKIDKTIYTRQLNGEILSLDETDENIGKALADMTIWDNYKLTQITADSFTVKKRTRSNTCAYIDSNFGSRSKGLVFVGDEKGGIAVCMRDFWQKYPSSVWANKLSTDNAELTAWIVTPDAEAMDMRHYDTVAHASAYYEGFNEIGSSPVGIANTNELSLFMFDGVAADDTLMACADSVQKPAVLVADPEYYHSQKALGEWSLPVKNSPLTSWLEDELDKAFDFYKNEIEQRHWYGLFNYGDVMHTYDAARHCWKYDMGGYAWQNTELVPTLWLWYAFLRSGREDIFTVAEAMSRHAADVDIYHFGDLKGLGSRHNVIHWGDSCKEPRIAMAGHHRALYYLLGGDLRMSDVFDDVKDADFATLNMDPLRFFYDKSEMKLPTHARSGPDWSTYCSNWYTAWERTGDEKYKQKIQTGIDDLKKAPMRMISGSNFEYDPETGHLGYIGESAAGGSHLAVCMGGPQTWMELTECLDDKVFSDMLAEFGEFYYKTPEQKEKDSNGIIRGVWWPYPYMAAGLAAYSAKYQNKPELAYKVWQVLVHSLAGKNKDEGFDKNTVSNYFNNKNLDEMFWISTNFTAQWCLNTIVALELTKEWLPNDKEDCEWEDWVK